MYVIFLNAVSLKDTYADKHITKLGINCITQEIYLKGPNYI